MNLRPFEKAENDFFLLKGQLAASRITQEQFDAAADNLTVRDEYGRAWRMDRTGGAWQIEQNDEWVAASPESPPPPPASPAPAPKKDAAAPANRNLVPILALGGALILCLCGVGAFLFLNALGIITTQVNLFSTATPTQAIALATATLSASATPALTRTPTRTATSALGTATPTTTSSSAPTLPPGQPTPSLPETFPAFDADFFNEPCPLFVGNNDTREYACDFGEYYMLHKEATTRYAYYDASYEDAVIEATGYLIEGSGKYEYGVVFRANADGTRYYVFTVTNDGKYNVSLYQNDAYTDLIPYTESSLVNTGTDFISFRIITQADQFSFYLNDGFIGTVIDTAIASGVVGLFFYNGEPNTEVGFDQLTISTFVPPTATPPAEQAEATPTVGSVVVPTVAVRPGVYVSNLRLSPGAPKRGEPITFYPTFVNSTGRPASFDWLVEIWEQDTSKRNPYGQADARERDIPAGTTERATGDSWKVAGGGPCLPFRARVVFEDDQSRRVPFKRTNDSDLWLNFQVCP